jgi:transposase
MSHITADRWAAVDWGDQSHAVVVIDDQGDVVLSFQVPHTAEGLRGLVQSLRECGAIQGVAVEQARNLMVHQLLQGGFIVYPINPKLSDTWRKGWKVTAPKSDPTDARVLADGLRHHHAHLRPLLPDDPLTRELAMLCADECALIGQRTALVNQLQAALKEYYPSALEWFSDWTSPTAWDFVLTFPRPEALQRASRKKVCGFLRAHHIGLTPLWQGRVDQRDQAAAWPSDPPTVEAKEFLAVALAKQLRTLQANLEAYRKRIEELYQQHPDAFLFSSLPGAGPKLGPRLLSHFGSDRARFTSAQSLQQLSGTVPVTRQSGRRREVVIRRACQKPFRKTMHLFAFQTIERSAWARAFYDRARQAGQPHSLALRNLASKWLKVIYRMWQDRVPYEESTYLSSLARRGSPLAAQLALAAPGGKPVDNP